MFESFKPDLLVTQLGVDGHYLDPLAQLTYTSHGLEAVLRKLRDMSSKMCDIGWLAVGGGGYHPVNVARLWSLFLAVMVDEKVPKKLPDQFQDICSELGYEDRPEMMRDEEEIVQMYISREEVALELDRVIQKAEELIFPHQGL
jgi:acetoin utilization protein AcuC